MVAIPTVIHALTCPLYMYLNKYFIAFILPHASTLI
jgi:hypothetical protein